MNKIPENLVDLTQNFGNAPGIVFGREQQQCWNRNQRHDFLQLLEGKLRVISEKPLTHTITSGTQQPDPVALLVIVLCGQSIQN